MFYNLTEKRFGKELSPSTITKRLKKYLREAAWMEQASRHTASERWRCQMPSANELACT
jgi:hypothetical protein